MEFIFGDNSKRSDNIAPIDRSFKISNEDFETQPPRALFAWWNSYQPDMPIRSAFNISDHRLLPPYIYLVEVLSPTEFLYKLNGEHVVALVGRSMSNQKISTTSERYEDQVFSAYLADIVEHRTACRVVGNLSAYDRKHIEFESVDCPLSDETGKITHIIGALKDRNGDIL